jgi:hypothetical protein
MEELEWVEWKFYVSVKHETAEGFFRDKEFLFDSFWSPARATRQQVGDKESASRKNKQGA